MAERRGATLTVYAADVADAMGQALPPTLVDAVQAFRRAIGRRPADRPGSEPGSTGAAGEGRFT